MKSTPAADKKVQVRPEQLRQTKWREYLIRFVFGGLITALAGFIAGKYGPVIGGLFLAFPAILPASATLIEKHSGKDKAKDDTSGAAFGAAGLLTFGAAVWLLSTRLPPPWVLAIAFVAWLAVGTGVWYTWQHIRG